MATDGKGTTTRRGQTTKAQTEQEATKPIDSQGETQLRGDALDGQSTVSPDRVNPNAPLHRDGVQIIVPVDDPREGETSEVEPVAPIAGSDVPEDARRVLFRPFPEEQVVIEDSKPGFRRFQQDRKAEQDEKGN